MTQPSQLDPVTVTTALAALVFGPSVAALVGPYAVIIIGASTGAAWAVGRQEPMTRTGVMLYFARLNAMAVLLTVSFAEIAKHWGGFTEDRWLLAPIALLVGGVGDDWPRVGKWVIERLGRLVDRKIDKPTQGD